MRCANARRIACRADAPEMSDLGSPFWQNVLLYGAALVLLWEVYSGWRRGLIRSGLHFGAFVASGLLGMLIGQTVAAMVGLVLPGIAFAAGLITGSAIALLVLGVCLFLSALVFKRTSQQPPGMTRWFFGVGGAFFGLLTGLFLLWGGVSLIRTSGALAKSGMSGRPAKDAPATTRVLASLKDSLEMGPVGELVESVDILPNEAYERIIRVGELSRNQAGMVRFLDYPGVQEIVAHPRMQSLLEDPTILQAVENKDFLVLMRSRTLINAATDPDLQKLVLQLDLEKALDYAMPANQDSASPTPTP